MQILETQNLAVRVGDAQLLKNISISIEPGETMAVVGPNGAGKSTLLKAITGEIEPHSGQALFCGKGMKTMSAATRAQSLGVLPQSSSLSFPYRVEEVVALGRTPHSSGRQLDEDIVSAAMAAVDISYLLGRLYPSLSGGEKQRVQLARVMTQIWRAEDAAWRLLLLDEPTAALDLGHQQQLMRAIKQFASQEVGVFFIAHDFNVAIAHADKLLVLCCGEMAAYGPPEEVVTEVLLKELFQADVSIICHPTTGKKFVFA